MRKYINLITHFHRYYKAVVLDFQSGCLFIYTQTFKDARKNIRPCTNPGQAGERSKYYVRL